MTTELPEYKRSSLEQIRAGLHEEHRTVTAQFGRTRDDADAIKLKRELEHLEQQIEEIDQKLRAAEPTVVSLRSSPLPRIGTPFINRPEKLDEIVDGLTSSIPAVVIFGLDGMGKTMLAHQVARECLSGKPGLPKFKAVVWIDASKLPGTPALKSTLDGISSAFGFFGWTQLPDDEQQQEIEKLFGQHEILLIIDDFEIVTDMALVNWLLALPAPSKVLIVSRENRKVFLDFARVVQVGGLTKSESSRLIEARLQLTKTRDLAWDLDQFDPLVENTGGSPKALGVCLGLIQYGRSVEQVADDVGGGRIGELDVPLGQAWSLLDETARKILALAILFPGGASAEALGETAAIDRTGPFLGKQDMALRVQQASERDGLPSPELATALARLTNLSLLDGQRSNYNQPARYTVHPLVKAFVQAHVSQHQKQAQRIAWLEWANRTAIEVGGWKWEDPKSLELLKPEEENLYAALTWAAHQPSYDEVMSKAVITIAMGLDHYYYIRGRWRRKGDVDRMRIRAARALGDRQEEVRALAQHIQLLCRKGDISQAEDYLSQLHDVEQETDSLSADIFTQVQHAYAFYYMSKGEYDRALETLDRCMRSDQQSPEYLAVATSHWIATCYYRQKRYAEAEAAFNQVLAEATKIGYQRSAIYCQLHLAKITLDLHLARITPDEGKLKEAAKDLAECLKKAIDINDLRYVAQIQVAYARLYAQWNNYPSARSALNEAERHYERLGLHDDREFLDRARRQVHHLRLAFEDMLEKIASAHTRILMMDYDGTLAPFVDSRQRDKAVPYPGVLKALTAIQAAGRAHLVIVSGRAIEDLKPLLTLDTPLEIWGIHGWERQFADGVYQGPEIENKAKESFAEARRAVLASGLGFAPVDLEPKPSKEPVSLALHWRGQDPDRIAALEASVRELWEPLAESASLQLTNFDGGLELMLPGKDKGLAVRTILSEAKPGALAVYLGDEETDEDAFKAIEEPGFGILIRSEYRPTAATFWLKPPDELLQFLKHWT